MATNTIDVSVLPTAQFIQISANIGWAANQMSLHDALIVEAKRRDDERAALRAEVERRIAEIESLNLKLSTLNAAIDKQPESVRDDISGAYAEIVESRSNAWDW